MAYRDGALTPKGDGKGGAWDPQKLRGPSLGPLLGKGDALSAPSLPATPTLAPGHAAGGDLRRQSGPQNLWGEPESETVQEEPGQGEQEEWSEDREVEEEGDQCHRCPSLLPPVPLRELCTRGAAAAPPSPAEPRRDLPEWHWTGRAQAAGGAGCRRRSSPGMVPAAGYQEMQAAGGSPSLALALAGGRKRQFGEGEKKAKRNSLGQAARAGQENHITSEDEEGAEGGGERG